MDWNRVEGNWKQVKGKVKEQCGKLTDDDITTFKVVFQRFPVAPQLMANWYVPRGQAAVSETRQRQFLATAWKIASDKARELGWIA
jgi:hypothetical protein